MNFKPNNRHLWIMPIEKEEKKEEPLFVMPEEYAPPKSPYIIGDIIGMSEDCTIDLKLGDRVVVERTTVQTIKADTETIYVVKENYVYGSIED